MAKQEQVLIIDPPMELSFVGESPLLLEYIICHQSSVAMLSIPARPGIMPALDLIICGHAKEDVGTILGKSFDG